MSRSRRRRADWRALAATGLVVLVSACGPADGGDPAATDPAAAPTTSDGPAAPEPSTASPDGGETAVTTDFSERAPGPRRGPITVADILITSQETLDPELVDQITELDGVTSWNLMSLSNVSVENKVYNLAAVDPATYRNFTVEGADFQDQWDRVAGGEVAVAPELERVLPLGRRDYLELGDEGGDASTAVHVGAFGPQVEQIDLVVNERRGQALGMVPGNALLISTGQTSPETLRDPIGDVVGDDVSVQNLDAVARYGLDLDAILSVSFVGTFADAVGTFSYTPIGDGRVQPAASWVSSHITTEVMPIIGAMTCNVSMMPQLRAALLEIQAAGLAAEIHPSEYAGCYYPRFIAGTSTLSNHSFGLAFDINVPGNGRGTVGEIDRGVVAIFKRWGFDWGGDWSYTDPMHFELARIVRPG